MTSQPEVLRNALDRPKVLVVDDQPYIREILSRWLVASGCQVTTASSAEEARTAFEDGFYGLVVSDINMPGDSGLDLLRWIRGRFDEQVAVLMVTALDDRQMAVDALKSGAYGYVVKPFDETEIIINVANALQRRTHTLQTLDATRLLEDTVRERTADLRAREEEMAWRLLRAVDSRDADTGTHVRRIGLFAEAMATAIGWEPQQANDIKLAAAMHDLGKLGISEAVLGKPGRLTLDERADMQRHTTIGAEILGGSDIPLLRMAAEIALGHHERWDGRGYPQRLVGEAIPESARIVAIVDVYDALLSDRPYRPAMPVHEVLDRMQASRGKHFDPRLFDIFMSIRPQLDRLLLLHETPR